MAGAAAEATCRGLILEDLGLDAMVARCTPMAPQPRADKVARRSAALAAELLVGRRISRAARAGCSAGHSPAESTRGHASRTATSFRRAWKQSSSRTRIRT